MGRSFVFVALALTACDPGTNAGRSCAGERVLECDPYEWSVVSAASFTPEVPIGDPTVMPRVQVTLETCGGSTPSTPEVLVEALLGQPDGGAPARVVSVTTVRAASADATTIDVTIENPFSLGGSVPPEEDITLRFIPVVGGCDGEALTIPYRTGELIRP
jgi:hypothetical protein